MELTADQRAALEEQKQYCPFCKIIKGEIPAQKVYEDEHFLAILDINPAKQGHTLLVPKEHYPVLAFLSPEEQTRLANLIPQVSNALKESMLVPKTEIFIANGPAAGQQSSHFLIHLIPSDVTFFHLPETESEQAPRLRQALAQAFQDPRERLVQIISKNPELKKMIIEQPDELIKNLPSAPDLAKLFAGVDIKALSKELRSQEEPAAVRMNDNELAMFIDGKEKLKSLLLADLQTLEMAIETQPKLKAFFAGTTPAVVLERYKKVTGGKA